MKGGLRDLEEESDEGSDYEEEEQTVKTTQKKR